jgi:hypothetical protein
MTDDAEMNSKAPAQPMMKKKPYCTPTIVDYGPVSQLAQSGASGGFMDGVNMSSMCSGNCQ